MTSRERSFVIGGALLSALILIGGLLPRLRSGEPSAEAAAVELEEERLARLRGLAGSVDTLEATVRRAQQAERRLQSRYLQGTTPQVSAAELSALLQGIADSAEVEIMREGVLPPTPTGRTAAIPLQIVGRSDLRGMLGFLEGIRQAPLLLSVESVSVSGDAGAGSSSAVLTFTLQVVGYTLPASSGQGGP